MIQCCSSQPTGAPAPPTMNYEDEEIPRSLIAQYNRVYAMGRYTGTLSEYVSISYLVYRTNHRGEAKSRKKWLADMLEQERQGI